MESKEQLPLTSPSELNTDMSIVRESLIRQLEETRKELGLTQQELADRAGIARMTVQRAEAPEAGPSLSTFLLLALALNLTPLLEGSKSGVNAPRPENLVHRGMAHNRTEYDLEYRDRQREKALADAWEALNAQPLHTPLLNSLLKDASQEQASAAATVIQWLGSEIGFAFLTEALQKAGYELLDTRKNAPLNAKKHGLFSRT